MALPARLSTAQGKASTESESPQTVFDQSTQMIERYTIKAAPAVSHKEFLKKLENITDPTELRKHQHLKLRIEVICEAEDFKKISNLMKQLSRPDHS
jgi:hypothetical protein